MAIEAPTQRRNPAEIMIGILGPETVTHSPAIDTKPTPTDPKRALLAQRRAEMVFIHQTGVNEVLRFMASSLRMKGLEGRVVSNYKPEDIMPKPREYDAGLQMYKPDRFASKASMDQPYEVGIAIGLPGEQHGAVRISVTAARDEKGDFAGLRFANKDITAAPSDGADAEEAFVTRFSTSIQRHLPRFSSQDPKAETLSDPKPTLTETQIYKKDPLVEETNRLLEKHGVKGVVLANPGIKSLKRGGTRSKGGSGYDSSLQMFVHEPQTPDERRLEFYQWLLKHDRLETPASEPIPSDT